MYHTCILHSLLNFYARCGATVSELMEEKLFVKKSKDLAKSELQPFIPNNKNKLGSEINTHNKDKSLPVDLYYEEVSRYLNPQG